MTFTLNFSKRLAGNIVVNATVDGSQWSGPVNYNVVGPYVDSGYSVPETFNNLPTGTYTVSYTFGGPQSAVLDKVTPAPTQTLPPGGNLTFTLYFVPVLKEGTK